MARLQDKPVKNIADNDKELDLFAEESSINTEEDLSEFDVDLIKNYPFSENKVPLRVSEYGYFKEENCTRAQSIFISPHGIEFSTSKDFDIGSLVKINVVLPDYWGRKQEFVEYGRIDKPKNFKVIARVIKVDQQIKSKKKNIIVETLNIDDVDAKVLKKYLMDKKKSALTDSTDTEES